MAWKNWGDEWVAEHQKLIYAGTTICFIVIIAAAATSGFRVPVFHEEPQSFQLLTYNGTAQKEWVCNHTGDLSFSFVAQAPVYFTLNFGGGHSLYASAFLLGGSGYITVSDGTTYDFVAYSSGEVNVTVSATLHWSTLVPV